MRAWYQIEGSEDSLRNIRGKLNEGKFLVRRSADGHVYSCISVPHQETLKAIAKSFGGHLSRLDGPPDDIKDRRTPKKDEYASLCGAMFYDPALFSQHQARCTRCSEIRGTPLRKRRPKNGRAVIVGRLAPGQPLTLDGVIASVECVHDMLFSEIEALSGLLLALKNFREKRDIYTKMLIEAKQIRSSVKLILTEIGNTLEEKP